MSEVWIWSKCRRWAQRSVPVVGSCSLLSLSGLANGMHYTASDWDGNYCKLRVTAIINTATLGLRARHVHRIFCARVAQCRESVGSVDLFRDCRSMYSKQFTHLDCGHWNNILKFWDPDLPQAWIFILQALGPLWLDSCRTTTFVHQLLPFNGSCHFNPFN